jgi:hypothetical protein
VIASGRCRLELSDVAGDHRRVETELLAAEYEVVRVRVAPKRVERLGQRLTPAWVGGLWPEQTEKLVAAQALRAGHGQNGEHGQAPGLQRGPAKGLGITGQPQPAERA